MLETQDAIPGKLYVLGKSKIWTQPWTLQMLCKYDLKNRCEDLDSNAIRVNFGDTVLLIRQDKDLTIFLSETHTLYCTTSFFNDVAVLAEDNQPNNTLDKEQP